MSPFSARPAWVDGIDAECAPRIDACELLARGIDPRPRILDEAGPLAVGEAMIVDAPFDPLPLRRLLGGMGFVAHAERLADEHWRVWFRREEIAAEPVPAAASGDRVWREGGVPHIDVRGLEPPEPMLAILRLLEEAGTDRVVIVHHEREPLYLYPELAERGWSYARLPGEPGEIRLWLERVP